jgi:hypothetical protein
MVSMSLKKPAPIIVGLRKKSKSLTCSDDQPWKWSPTSTNPFDDDYCSIPSSSPSSSSSSSSESYSVQLTSKRRARIQNFLQFFRKRNERKNHTMSAATDLCSTPDKTTTNSVLIQKSNAFNWKYSLQNKYHSRAEDENETNNFQIPMFDEAGRQSTIHRSRTMEIDFTSNSIVERECDNVCDCDLDEDEEDSNNCDRATMNILHKMSNRSTFVSNNEILEMNVAEETSCLNSGRCHDSDERQHSSETQEHPIIISKPISTIESCNICSSVSAHSRWLDHEQLDDVACSSSAEIHDETIDNDVDEVEQSQTVEIDKHSQYIKNSLDYDDGVSSISLDSLRRHNPYWTPEHQELMSSPPLIVSFVANALFCNETRAINPLIDEDFDDGCSWLSLPPRSTNQTTNINMNQNLGVPNSNLYDVLPEWQASWLNHSRSFDSPIEDDINNKNIPGTDDWLTPTLASQERIHCEVKRSPTRWKWSAALIITPSKHERTESVSKQQQQQQQHQEEAFPIDGSPSGRSTLLDTSALLRPLRLRFHKSVPFVPVLDHSQTNGDKQEKNDEPTTNTAVELELRPTAVLRSKSTPLSEIQNINNPSTTKDRQGNNKHMHDATCIKQLLPHKQQDKWITSPLRRQHKFRMSSPLSSKNEEEEDKNDYSHTLHIPNCTTTTRPPTLTWENYMTSTGAVMMSQLSPIVPKCSTDATKVTEQMACSLNAKHCDNTLHTDAVAVAPRKEENDVIPIPTLPNLLPPTSSRGRPLPTDRLLVLSPHSQHRRTLSSPLTNAWRTTTATSPSGISKSYVSRYRSQFNRGQSEATTNISQDNNDRSQFNRGQSEATTNISQDNNDKSHNSQPSNDNDSVLKNHSLQQEQQNQGHPTMQYMESSEASDNIDSHKTSMDDKQDNNTLFWHNGRLQILASPHRYNTLYGMKNVIKKINKENIKEFLV